MANYINKYANMSSWLNDTDKDFPNVSYWTEEDKINWEDNNPFRLKLFYQNGDEYTLECGEGQNPKRLMESDVTRGISSSSDPHYKSKIVKAIIGDYETALGYTTNIEGFSVFQYCDNLEEVVFGKNLSLIGKECFYYCNKLKIATTDDMILPDSLTTIGEYAFYNGFTVSEDVRRKLFIPKKLTSGLQQNNSDSGEYSGCFGDSYYRLGFDSIVVDPENTKYDSRENCNAIINKVSNKLILAANYNAFLPSSVTKIADMAFKYSDITSVDLSNVDTIGMQSFMNCYNLETVTIGDKITTLPQQCFFDTKWKNVYIPSQITSIFEVDSDGYHNRAVLPNYYKIESIVVDPENTTYDSRENCNCIIKTSENKVIYVCSNSTLPSTVTKIGSGVFTGTDTPVDAYLTTIDLSNITHIDTRAFTYQIKLTELNLPSIVETGTGSFVYCNGLEKIDFGSNIQQIKGFVFSDPHLNTIICRATTPPNIDSYTFSRNGNKNNNIKNIYVPYESVTAYQTATNWSRYSTIIKPLSEYVAS